MITKQDNLRAEIICHISGSFQNEDPSNCLFSKQEVYDYLQQCFDAKDKVDSLFKDMFERIHFIATMPEYDQDDSHRLRHQAKMALDKLKPLIQ